MVSRIDTDSIHKFGVSELGAAEEEVVGNEGKASLGGVVDVLALELVQSRRKEGEGMSSRMRWVGGGVLVGGMLGKNISRKFHEIRLIETAGSG